MFHQRLHRRRPLRNIPKVRCPKVGKVCWTLNDGVEQLARMAFHMTDPDPFRPVHLYRCEYGPHWHIGHRPQRLNRRGA